MNKQGKAVLHFVREGLKAQGFDVSELIISEPEFGLVVVQTSAPIPKDVRKAVAAYAHYHAELPALVELRITPKPAPAPVGHEPRG